MASKKSQTDDLELESQENLEPLTEATEVSNHNPVEGELTNPEPEKPVSAPISQEKVRAEMMEKLSRRKEEGSDPFVPSSQLENEVQEVARSKGFPLNRGTEIGARLIAKNQRTNRK